MGLSFNFRCGDGTKIPEFFSEKFKKKKCSNLNLFMQMSRQSLSEKIIERLLQLSKSNIVAFKFRRYNKANVSYNRR